MNSHWKISTRLCLTTILFLSEIARATSGIAIKTEPASEAAFAAWLDIHPDLIPLSRHILHSLPDESRKESLFKDFERIKALELGTRTAEMLEGYQGLTDQFFDTNWASDVLPIFQHAFGVLAGSGSGDKHEWINWYFKTGGTVDQLPAAARDLGRLLWAEQLSQTKPMDTLSLRIAGVRYVILNGRVWNLAQRAELQIPPGRNRLVLVGDHFLPVSKMALQDELIAWTPRLPALSTEECGQLFWPESLDNQSGVLFADLNCTLKHEKTKAVALKQGWDTLSTEPAAGSDLSPVHWPAPSESTPIYKQNYFWIGVIALAAGAAKIYSDQQRPSVETVRIARP